MEGLNDDPLTVKVWGSYKVSVGGREVRVAVSEDDVQGERGVSVPSF
jgi:hypothetical protein